MFTVAIFYRRPYDAFEAASYAALHRVGWCLGIAWVIFACVTNNAGKIFKKIKIFLENNRYLLSGSIDSFLRKRTWVVLSRLSYCSYLVNGLVELHTIGTLRHTRNLTNLQIVRKPVQPNLNNSFGKFQAKETISHIVITYALALMFSLIFEAPILGIENLLLKNASKGKKSEEKVSNPSISGESTQTDTTA